LLSFSPDEIPNAVAHARKHPEQDRVRVWVS